MIGNDCLSSVFHDETRSQSTYHDNDETNDLLLAFTVDYVIVIQCERSFSAADGVVIFALGSDFSNKGFYLARAFLLYSSRRIGIDNEICLW